MRNRVDVGSLNIITVISGRRDDPSDINHHMLRSTFINTFQIYGPCSGNSMYTYDPGDPCSGTTLVSWIVPPRPVIYN